MGVLVIVTVLSAGHSRAGPEPDRPACAYCRMILEDERFGAEITTRSGARRRYDAIECMAAAVLTDSVPQRDIRAIVLVDHDAPHARIALARTVFVHCPEVESPMGLSLLAFPSRTRAARACSPRTGRVLDWRGVLTHVNETWFQGRLTVTPAVVRLAAPRDSASPHPRR